MAKRKKKVEEVIAEINDKTNDTIIQEQEIKSKSNKSSNINKNNKINKSKIKSVKKYKAQHLADFLY